MYHANFRVVSRLKQARYFYMGKHIANHIGMDQYVKTVQDSFHTPKYRHDSFDPRLHGHYHHYVVSHSTQVEHLLDCAYLAHVLYSTCLVQCPCAKQTNVINVPKQAGTPCT